MALTPPLNRKEPRTLHDSSGSESSWQLLGAGFGMLVLLVLAAFFYHVPALASNRAASELFAWLMAGGMLTAYWLGYRALKAAPGTSHPHMTIVGFAVTFGLVALIIPPFHSVDIFCYINRGWQQVGYGLNPYVHSVRDMPNWQLDPMFRPYWTEAPSPYGFLFEALARGICYLGRGNWLATLLLFKVTSLVIFAFTGWVVWAGYRSLRLPYPERALYLILWNPLLIVHCVVNGHNDLWMGMLTSVGVYLAVMGSWLWALPALMAGTLIKYASATLLPFTVLFLGKRVGWRKAGAGAGLAVAVFALSAWPYLPKDWRSLLKAQGGANTTVQNSVAGMILFPFEMAVNRVPSLQAYWPQVANTITLVFGAAFLVFYAVLAWVRLRGGGRYDRDAYLRDCVLIQFVLICVASSKFYAWYLGMFFPLALWLPEDDRLRRVVLAVACASLLSLTFVAQAHFLNATLMLVIPLIWALRSGNGSNTTLTLD